MCKCLMLCNLTFSLADFSSSSFDFNQGFSKTTQPGLQASAPSNTQAAAPPIPTNASTTNATEQIDQETLDTILVKYKAVFQFDAQNEDELSIKPGDIIMVRLGRKKFFQGMIHLEIYVKSKLLDTFDKFL